MAIQNLVVLIQYIATNMQYFPKHFIYNKKTKHSKLYRAFSFIFIQLLYHLNGHK